MADAGFRLTVEGELEFKRALEQIDARVKANKAEIKALTLEYNANGGSVDTLRQKSATLMSSIEAQTAKVNGLGQKYRDAAASLGENDKATQQIKASYNAAQAALLELNAQLAENEKRIAEVQDASAGYIDRLALLDAQLAENASKIELIAAQHEMAGSSADQHRQKIAVLSDSIAAQSEKLSVLKTQLAAVEQKYGTNSKEAAEYRTAINKAQAELVKMNTELENSKKAASNAAGGMTMLSTGLSKLASQFGINLPASITSATNKIDGFTLAGSLSAAVLVGLTTKLAQCAINASNAADEIMTLSSVAGMSTDAVQELRYAAELVDVSFETVSGSMSRMIRTMNNAKNGSDEAQQAFRALRVRVTDTNGQLRDANDIFYQVIDRLGKVRNETERDAIAMQIFGRSARELNPLIEAGSDRLRELAEEAHKAGYVMGEDTLNKYGQLNDAMMRMNNAADAAKNSLGMIFLPILTDLFEAVSKLKPETAQTLVVITSIVAGVVLVISTVGKLINMANSIAGFLNMVSGQTMKTTLIIMGVIAALILLGIIIAKIIGKGDDLKSTFSAAADSIEKMTGVVNKAQTAPVPRYARGTSYHPGGLAIVGEEGPELVELPAGSKVYPNRRGGASGAGTVNNYYITISASDVREFNDMIRIAESQRLSTRMGYAGRRGV